MNTSEIKFSVPISKIDTENRIVSGWATLDNVDQQGDIITADCSRKAFENFRGNLRLMHNPIPVGKVVDFKNDVYYDTKTDSIYNGVWVSAYISKGAEDTWIMVNDKTLTGFSIGGRANPETTKTVIKDGSPVRVINDMTLYELSLVDSPANQLANIVSIQKINGEDSATGLATDVKIQDMYWCPKCETIQLDLDPKRCKICDANVEHIGWIENTGPEDIVPSMQKVFSAWKQKAAGKGPYSELPCADPGYQADGHKRYPIDTEAHARAAWSYINQADNAKEYTAEQLKAIKDKIKSALRRFGVQIAEDANKSSELIDSDADQGLQKNEGGDLMDKETIDEIEKSDSAPEVVDEAEAELPIEKSESEETEPEDVIEKSDDSADVEAVEKDIASAVDLETVEEAVEEVNEPAKEEVVETPGQELGEEAAENEDAGAEDDQVEVDTLKAVVSALETLTAQVSAVSQAVAGMVDSTQKNMDTLRSDLEASIEEVSKSLEVRVENVEAGTAIKKSGELGGSTEQIKKGVWNGAFAPRQFFDSNSIIKEG